MKLWKWLLASWAVSSLVACGGSVSSSDGSGGTDGGGTDTPVAVSAVEVLSSSNQVGTAGEQVTITAFVKGAGNVTLAEAPVSFTASSGTLTSAASATDTAGVATALLSAGADRGNRTVTVTVTSGAVSGSVDVLIAGTTLTVAGATTVGLSGAEVLTVKATDSKGGVIASLPVTATSSLGNALSSGTLTTDSQGQAMVTYTASNAGTDTLTFSGGGSTATSSIQISGEDFKIVTPAPSATIAVGTTQTVTARYLSGGVPQAGVTVQFTSTAGTVTPTSGVTNASGEVSAQLSSSSASIATVQATLAAPAAQATLPVEFVATVPATLVLQVSPTAIGPNPAGSTAQQAQVLATVKDANGNPVKGVTVNFNRIADASGGNLNQPSAVTNSSGQASVQYIAGAQSTASNGVRLQATVASTTTVVGNASLTVNQSALFIGLGQGNTISNVDETTYNKVWTVYVTDANGNPVSDVTLTMKALPNQYRKGSLAWNGKAWVYARTYPDAPDNIYGCKNEDRNFDGALARLVGEDVNQNGVLDEGEDKNTNDVLDTSEDVNKNKVLDADEDFNSNGKLDAEEDLNGNGRLDADETDFNENGVLDTHEDDNNSGTLEPGNVIVVSPATVRTNSQGRATVNLQYAESYAKWVEIRLRAEAVVQGTESSTESLFFVEGLSTDYTNENVAPAGVVSPFGVNPCATPN